MTRLRLIKIILNAAILSSIVQLALAQSGSWLKIAPAKESFTIMMPTPAVETARLFPVGDKGFIHERVFQSLGNGKRFTVVSFVKTTPGRVPDLSNFNSFASLIEGSFEGSEQQAVLSYDHDLTSATGKAKQYRLSLGEYRGIVRLIEAEKAFYAVVVVGAGEDDVETQQFFSSFVTGEPNATGENNVIVDSPANAVELNRVRSATPPEPWPRSGSPIMGGVLNGKAVELQTPKYPTEASEAHQSGQVTVQILIDEQGLVIWAEATEGPESLRAASVEAARRSRFSPTRLMGQPIKVKGVIIYNFVAQ